MAQQKDFPAKERFKEAFNAEYAIQLKKLKDPEKAKAATKAVMESWIGNAGPGPKRSLIKETLE